MDPHCFNFNSCNRITWIEVVKLFVLVDAARWQITRIRRQNKNCSITDATLDLQKPDRVCAVMVCLPVHALVEEGQGCVGVGHEGPLFNELGKHLSSHQNSVKLVVVAVP